MTIKVLDCTLRDGGYYTSWNFDKELINKYLKDIKSSNIDAVELGFRFLERKNDWGPLAYTSDQFLENFKLPSEIQYAVMINGSEYASETDQISLIDKNFTDRSLSKISMVRIAINFDNFKETKVLTELLKKKGYKVGLNLMQVHGKGIKDYEEAAFVTSNWSTVDLIYLADSLGVLEPKDINKIVKIRPFFMRQFW